MQTSFLPIAAWQRVEAALADSLLVAWGHYLGPCGRPFGRQDFGLVLAGDLVSVAVSASTVSATLANGRWHREDVVELARLCSRPDSAALTRVTLRLWRETAAASWRESYFPGRPLLALVAYSDASRHRGEIYRTDGWARIGTNPGSSGGGTWTKKRERRTPKMLWAWTLDAAS